MAVRINPSAWQDQAREALRNIAREKIAAGIPDVHLWNGNIPAGDAVVRGFKDQIVSEFLRDNPDVVSSYPPGDALYTLGHRYGDTLKRVLKEYGYELFPSRAVDSHDRFGAQWVYARIPGPEDSADYWKQVSHLLRLRGQHHESHGEARHASAREDGRRADLFAEEAQRRERQEQRAAATAS